MKKVLLLIVSLVFCGSIFAQYEPYWLDIDDPKDNPGCYPYSYFNDHDPLIAMVELDNHLMTPNDNFAAFEVAAFVNGYYRGHGFMKWYEEYDDEYPIVEFEIYYQPQNVNPYEPGNENEGPKAVTFKLYDHSTNTLYEYGTSSVAIETQTMYNSYDFNVMPTLSFFHTFTKPIDPYADHDWYFIASPLNEDVLATDVVGLTTADYDFYSFEQNPDDGLEWINHRDEEGYALQNGVGYLYANSTGADLTFIGAPYNGNGEVTITKVEGPNAEFSGWNLIGNPFAEPASVDRSEFYVMKADGSGLITAEEDEVAAMEGIFVVAESSTETVTFTPGASKKSGQIVLNISQDRGNTIDRAIVRFGQGGVLPKFVLNPNDTKMYITKDNHDYAVVRGSNSGRLPVCFEPAQDGMYTINGFVEHVKNIRYLHLIDNVMGTDTDLLRTPIYKFEAKTADPADRFVLVFSTSPKPSKELLSRGDNSENFSFCNNGNWIINNEGDAILQVVDVNGQILSSEEINGSVSKRIDAAPGVYMLRLINGQDMKVQKIVVE